MNTAAPRAGLLSITARQWAILVAVQSSSLLFGMTITLANVVLPQMRGSLSATVDQIGWVVTLNLAATAIATPTTGWLASRLGWRGTMLGAVGGFTACSLLCGLANSLATLVIYRVGQGLFGALIMPMGQAIVLATFPRPLHTTVMVIWGFGSVVGPVVGPIVGAAIAETYSWRAVFFMIVPPGLVAMGFIWFALAGNTARTRARLDWVGFAALSVAMAALQLMIDRGQRLGWFTSPEIMADAAVAGAAFWMFAVHSLTSPAPFLDPRLLLNRNFSIGLLIAFFMGMLSYTSITLFPGLLHDLRGYPVGTIGELLSARGVGNWVAFLVVVPVSRRFPRLTVALGLAAQSFAAWSMAQLNLNLTSLDVFWTNALQGFGFGLAFTPMTVLAFATLPASRIAEASGVFTLVRNFGSSLYISLSLVLLVRASATSYGRLIEIINPFSLTTKGPAAPGSWDIGATGGLQRLADEVHRQASMIGYIDAFYMLALTAAIAVPFVAFMRARPLEG